MTSTSYESISGLLELKGGLDTGYIPGHRMPVNENGMPGLNCKDRADYPLQPVELRIVRADESIVRASVRRPEGKLRSPVLCSRALDEYGAFGTQMFEELQLDLTPDGEASLFGLPEFGQDREPLAWYDTTRSEYHDATISQCFGFATARLVKKIEVTTSGPLRVDESERSPGESADIIQNATLEITNNLHDSAPNLFALADQVVERATDWHGLIGEDSGGRLATLFIRKVLRSAGFEGLTFFIDTSKEGLSHYSEQQYREYLMYIATQIRKDNGARALFVTESVFTGAAYNAVNTLSQDIFDSVDHAAVTTSTITPQSIRNKVISGASVKPGTVGQFAAFEGVPLPQSLLSDILGNPLAPDITTIARPIGKNGYRYYPDTSVVTGVARSEQREVPVTTALTHHNTQMQSILREAQNSVRNTIMSLADTYTTLRARQRVLK